MLSQKLQQITFSLQELLFSKRPDFGRRCASALAPKPNIQDPWAIDNYAPSSQTSELWRLRPESGRPFDGVGSTAMLDTPERLLSGVPIAIADAPTGKPAGQLRALTPVIPAIGISSRNRPLAQARTDGRR